MIATAAAPRNNEQKIRRHDVNEDVGFGFVIIELLVRYGPPRPVFFFGFESDRNDASKPKRIVVSTIYRKLIFAEDGNGRQGDFSTRCPQHVDKRRGVAAWCLRLWRFGEPSIQGLHGESATGLAFPGEVNPP
jgi:hypothetical protein